MDLKIGMGYMHVDLHAPNGDEIHVKAFMTEHHVQILEINYQLSRYRATEHPRWDISGNSMNALLHGQHDPSMQLIQFRQALQQLPRITEWFAMHKNLGHLFRIK